MNNICFITDNEYILPTLTAIKSIIINAKNKTTIYIVCNCVPKNKVKLFKKLSTSIVTIVTIPYENNFENINTEHAYVSKSALIKFFLANIFIDIDKILYLDADIIVTDDLKSFYDINIDNYYAAVVSDKSALLREDNKIIGTKSYFNSGVMLLNLKKIRNDNISDKLLQYKINSNLTRYMDQDSFNVVFQEKVLYLPNKYNYIIRETAQDINNKNLPVIIHYAGSKPWKNYQVEKFNFWYKYFIQIPNSKEKYEIIHELNMKKYNDFMEVFKRKSKNYIKNKIIKRIFST